MKTLLIIFGTRPEAIKMAPIVDVLKKSTVYNTKVCVTAQHRDLLDQVLRLFDITADYDLNIMKPGQDLYDITSLVLLKLRDVLNECKPDAVLVHGDTTTSMTASLAAYYAQIPVFHIEAGLRTNNKYSPWPEEINRQITGRITSLHFSPTQLSQENLLKENIPIDLISVVGNSVIDALHMALERIREDDSLQQKNLSLYTANGIDKQLIEDWNSNKRKMVLITGHRRENFGKPFVQICEAIKELATKYPLVDFVYPVHPNPNVKKAIEEVFGQMGGINQKYSNLFFCSPLDYLPFISLMELSTIVLTDSGGIQEEAPGLGKPVLVMRDTTERPEGVEAGTVRLVGTNRKRIVDSVSELLESETAYEQMQKAVNPYGDGKTSLRIKNMIDSFFNHK